MVEFELKLNEKGYGCIPIEVRKQWGRKLLLIPNAEAGVIFKKGNDLKSVKESLEVLMKDIELRIARREREEKQKNEEDKEGSQDER